MSVTFKVFPCILVPTANTATIAVCVVVCAVHQLLFTSRKKFIGVIG